MTDENQGPPTLEEIREEIARCVDLIHRGSAVSAVARLTRLGWRMDGMNSLETPIPYDEVRAKKSKRKPIYAWEHEDALSP